MPPPLCQPLFSCDPNWANSSHFLLLYRLASSLWCLEERWWEGEEEICSFRSRYPLLNRLSCTTTTHLGLVSQRCSRIFKSSKGSPGVKKQNQFCFQCKILSSVQVRYNDVTHLVIQGGQWKCWVFSILITSSSLRRPKSCHRKLLWKGFS